MSLPATSGKAAQALRDTRERYLTIFSSCSTSTGLQLLTTFPPARQRAGRAAAPAPALPAASPRRNSCPASAPATRQRNWPAPPAALPRTPKPSRRAGSSCRAWSSSWKKRWRRREMTTRSKLRGNCRELLSAEWETCSSCCPSKQCTDSFASSVMQFLIAVIDDKSQCLAVSKINVLNCTSCALTSTSILHSSYTSLNDPAMFLQY